MAKKEAKQLIDMIKERRSLLAGVMSKYMTPDEMINIMTLAFGRQPELKECTPYSVLAAVMTAGQLGLKPSSPHGHCYMIPFRNKKTGRTEATFIIGYKGLIELAMRSGKVGSIEAYVVHKNDKFDVLQGTSSSIYHAPNIIDPGEMIAVYAVCKPKEFGDPQFEVMTKADVDKVRNSSKAGKSGPWSDWYEEMARKTVVKKLCKFLSLSPEMAIAVEVDNRAEASEVKAIDDVIDLKGVAEVLEVEDDKTPDLKEPQRKSASQQTDQPTKINDKQAKLLGVLIGKSKMPHGEIKKVFSVESLADIPRERMQDVVDYIEAYDSNFTPPEEEPTDLWAASIHNAKEVLGKDRFYQIIKGFKQDSKPIVHEDDITKQALKEIVLQKLSLEVDKVMAKEEK
ncbi:MAG: recombinase RecT [Nitrospira sp.]